jgi:hypothetical protein
MTYSYVGIEAETDLPELTVLLDSFGYKTYPGDPSRIEESKRRLWIDLEDKDYFYSKVGVSKYDLLIEPDKLKYILELIAIDLFETVYPLEFEP